MNVVRASANCDCRRHERFALASRECSTAENAAVSLDRAFARIVGECECRAVGKRSAFERKRAIVRDGGVFQRAVSDGTWKLIEYNVNGTRTTQLFNLQQDPYEMDNLAGETKQRKRITQLRQQMSRECETTHDPVERFWE